MILSLPVEVILEIFQRLETYDILSLRQTCTRLAEASKDKLIWANLLQRQRKRLPLPPNIRRNADGLSAEVLEASVIYNELVESLWLVPRMTAPVKMGEKRGEYLLGLDVFLDRWVLGIYVDGYINLWDTNEDSQQRWNSVHTGNDKTTSYQAALDESGDKLLVVITKVHILGEWTAALYEVQLTETAFQFTLLRTFLIPSSRIARQLCPSERIVAFSQLSSIELMCWPEDSKENPTSVSINNSQFDELEDIFTITLSLRVLDKHIFVFKTRSIELHPMPSDSNNSPRLSAIRHNLPSYNFREVRISDVESEESPSEGYRRYTLRMLASDVIQGLFFFVVNVTVPQGHHQSHQLPPILDVNLTAVYSMVNHLPLPGRLGEQPHIVGIRSSSFVSTYAMGSQGIRAIWIERRRGSTLKQIIASQLATNPEQMDVNAFKVDPEKALGESEEEEDVSSDRASSLPWGLDGQIIYSMRWEDVTHCTLGEVSGKIVLGNRSGDVFVLETGA